MGILEGLKLDNSTITTLISSVQSPEGFDKVKTAVLSGDMSSLSAVLKEQTGLDNTVITSTTNSIKEGIKPWQGDCYKHQGWDPARHFHGPHRRLSLQATPLLQCHDMCQKKQLFVADTLTMTFQPKLYL